MRLKYAALGLVLLLPSQLPAHSPVDKILVIKHNKSLLLLSNDEIVKEFKVALGRKSGPKGRRGDCKTPEGSYVIDRRLTKSKYYKALHISYPNANDLANAKMSSTATGGDILIHGLPRGFEDLNEVHTSRNWTKGCIAVSNDEMDEIWRLVSVGTPIQIVP